MGEGRLDMRFQGALGKGGYDSKVVKFMFWSGVGDGTEAEIDEGLGDIGPYIIGLKEGGGEPEVDTENRDRGQGNTEGV